MKNTLETRLGIFAALTVIAAVIILEIIGTDFFKRGYELHALFKNIMELKVGDQVKMAGVPIGRVEFIRITNDVVMVTMKMTPDAIVRTDSKATVKFTGLMGQNYVAIDMGTSKGTKADPNTFITTAEQPDFNTLMSRLDNVASGIENVTKSFSGDKIDNLLGPFTDFLKQNREPLSLMIGNFKMVSDNIAQGKGTVGKLVNDDILYRSALGTITNLETTAGDVRGMISDAKLAIGRVQTVLTNINATIDQVNSGQGTIGKLVKDEAVYAEAREAVTNLKEILQKANRGQGSVGKLVNDDSLIKNAKLTLQKLDKATESLEDQGPLSVLGMAVGGLF
jgi:phospholipid/cholesterol/gamma-HCH transport system substrate-binding protein